MKKLIFVLFLLMTLILIGCSQKLPYATSGEEFKVFYIVPENKDDEHFDRFEWLTDFHEEHSEIGLKVYDLNLTQIEYPSLNATETSYFYMLDRKSIILETSDFDEIKNYLIESTK
jgi:basic membrane lipoprotein Med (substrate-binding protein (PBP1-ABC) superfamily)